MNRHDPGCVVGRAGAISKLHNERTHLIFNTPRKRRWMNRAGTFIKNFRVSKKVRGHQDHHGGRVERRRDRFRPMASFVSALSSIVANSLQVMPTFPPPPLLIPSSRFSPVRLEASPSYGTLPLGFTKRLVSALAVHSVSGLSYPVFWYGSDAHRPLAQRGLSCPRLQALLRPDAPV